MCENDKLKVIIIGSGLVGSLCACFMAKRGYNVTVYEKREDCRTAKTIKGRSINLALSNRGRRALRTVGLENEVLENATPMIGRLLHKPSGELKPVLYDPATNECLYSIERNFFNRILLEAAEKYPNVRLYFNRKLNSSNFNEGSVTLTNLLTSETIFDKADMVIGSDGAFSALRLSMQQSPQFQFSQEYIEHGYLEMSIPPMMGEKMVPNYLHIWPRGEFMMIALPNKDLSWTVTLFMPFTRFEQLDNKERVLKFFKETFPDAIKPIGETEIVETFLTKKPSFLVSIRCKPFHVGSKNVIIGDAAHALVPFYGQGMNAGFEDCTILNELLDINKDNIQQSIKQFSDIRVEPAHAIGDLAMYNYVEMRDLVNRVSYRMRKKLDDFLFQTFPTMWIPLYNSVSFTTMDYTKCVENRKWQDNVIHTFLVALGLIFILIMVFIYRL